MITRLYVDNFKCLVNFEVELDQMNVFVGTNGSGKSTVFEVLRKIQSLVVGGQKVNEVFSPNDVSTLHTSNKQKFEIRILKNDETYDYSLTIEYDEKDIDRSKVRILEERLTHNSKSLFEFKKGTAHLYTDDYNAGPTYPFDWSQSGIGMLQQRNNNKKLTQFKDELMRFVIVHPCPPIFQAETKTEDSLLDVMMTNFVGWYRYVAQENMGQVGRLFENLKAIIPGFDSLELSQSGENARVMRAVFKTEKNSKIARYKFDQLSDGQRALIALYSIVYLSGKDKVSLYIDEPDNWLSLREIEPWLVNLQDLCGDSVEQVCIVSHHPVTIDQLVGSKGRWFYRDPESPARVSKEPPNGNSAISYSELIARGWER